MRRCNRVFALNTKRGWMLTFPDLSFLEAANLEFRIQFTRSQPALKPSGTGSSFPAVFVWHFAQAGSHLNQTATLTGFCVQTGKTVGLSERKKKDVRKIAPFLFPSRKHVKNTNMKTVGRRRGGKSEPGDSTAALVTTEETCFTAKSFQRAFIAVKGFFFSYPCAFRCLVHCCFFSRSWVWEDTTLQISTASVFSWPLLPKADKNIPICRTYFTDATVYSCCSDAEET